MTIASKNRGIVEGLLAGLVLALTLVGCTQSDNKRGRWKDYPVLNAEGPPCERDEKSPFHNFLIIVFGTGTILLVGFLLTRLVFGGSVSKGQQVD